MTRASIQLAVGAGKGDAARLCERSRRETEDLLERVEHLRTAGMADEAVHIGEKQPLFREEFIGDPPRLLGHVCSPVAMIAGPGSSFSWPQRSSAAARPSPNSAVATMMRFA